MATIKGPHFLQKEPPSRIFWLRACEGREDKSLKSTDASDIAEYEPVKKQAKMDNDIIVLVESPVQ